MSYDPRYGAQNQYSTYPPQQQYPDQGQEQYNPYNNAQPHRTYEQPGYGYQDTGYGGYSDEPAAPVPPTKEKETDAYVASVPTQPRSRRAMKRWRYEHQGNLWTGGSGLRCFGRFFGCTILVTLFLLASIVLSLLLWVKPPSIEIGSISPSAGTPFQIEDNGLTINLEVPVAVANPNYFSVKFDSINAKIFYPLNNTQIGGGDLTGLTIENEKQTNFTLPFALNYTTTIDPNFTIIADIADRCGFTGKATSQIKVNYEIELGFKIGLIPIKPTIKNSASFACPIKASDISGLLKSAGIDLPSLAALLESL